MFCFVVIWRDIATAPSVIMGSGLAASAAPRNDNIWHRPHLFSIRPAMAAFAAISAAPTPL
jgi:hypothetical protein